MSRSKGNQIPEIRYQKSDTRNQLVHRRLVRSVNEEGNSNPFADLAVKSLIERILFGRYKIEQELAKNPWIEGQPIKQPVFIIGMPSLKSNFFRED